MNERIKEFREKMGLSQEALGKALGIGRSAVSRIESGTNALTEANIRLLCQQYNVNREWLENGKGEMILQGDDALVAKVAEKYNLSPLDLEAFKLYVKLNGNDRNMLLSFAFSLAGKILENPILYRQYKEARGELPKLSQADIDVEVAAYRNELELLAAVEKAEDASKVVKKPLHEMSREEIHAEVDRQLDEEKEAVENASASGHGKSGMATG